MSNVYVVDINELGGTYSFLGFRNMLETAVSSGATEDADYPISNAFDHNDASEFSADTIGSNEFIFTAPIAGKINYFGLISKNGTTSELSCLVEVFDYSVSAYVEVANFTTDVDGRPVAIYFGSDKPEGYYESDLVKITLQSTTKAYVMGMFCGEAQVFPFTPSIGYQPGKMSPLDKVQQSVTEGNNFIRARRRVRGYQAKATFNYLDIDDVFDWYPDYQQHVLAGKAIFFAANNINPLDVIFGRQDPSRLTKPTYVTSFHANLSFEINGYA